MVANIPNRITCVFKTAWSVSTGYAGCTHCTYEQVIHNRNISTLPMPYEERHTNRATVFRKRQKKSQNIIVNQKEFRHYKTNW
jgi:hypothetical protein